VLVLAPTRELAMQIDTQCKKFASLCKIQSLAIYGGVPKGEQRYKIMNGLEILIATPGRLLDFIESGVVKLNRVTYLVLDEADRMLVSNLKFLNSIGHGFRKGHQENPQPGQTRQTDPHVERHMAQGGPVPGSVILQCYASPRLDRKSRIDRKQQD
jgi:hypothetical protein